METSEGGSSKRSSHAIGILWCLSPLLEIQIPVGTKWDVIRSNSWHPSADFGVVACMIYFESIPGILKIYYQITKKYLWSKLKNKIYQVLFFSVLNTWPKKFFWYFHEPISRQILCIFLDYSRNYLKK